MNKQVLAVILGTLVLSACNDDAAEPTNQEPCTGADCQDQDGLCNGKKCEADEKCVDGECQKQEVPVDESLCNGKKCEADEKCVDGECQKQEAPVDEGLCNGKKCEADEKCVEGECQKQEEPPVDEGLCGGKKCEDDELCIDDECQKPEEPCEGELCVVEPPEETCGGMQCKSGEICDNEKCVPNEEPKCGEKVCQDDEICQNGECVAAGECNPPCNENQRCDAGQCVDDGQVEYPPAEEIPAGIMVTPQSGLFTRRSGETAAISVVLNQPPSSAVMIPVKSLDESLGTVSPNKLAFDQENWDQIQSVVVTGTTKATVKDKTYNIQIGPASGDSAFQALEAITIPVTHIDDVVSGDCKAGQTKDDAEKCISVPVTSVKLKRESYNVLRDQTVTLVAEVEPSNASNKQLTWKFENTTEAKPNDKISNIIGTAVSKDTLSNKVTGLSKGARDVVVTITSKSNKSLKATAKLEIKPYYPLVNYNYMFGGNSPRRNLYYGIKDPNNKNKYILDDDGVKKAGSDDLTCNYFNEYTAHVFNHDLYTDIVRPKMMKIDGKYYATRASVVAAARFLTMQFPFDIPYYMGADKYSHYSWAGTKKGERKQGCEARIYGLNLRPKAFNNYNDDVKNDKGEYLYNSCKNSKGEYVTVVRENPKDDPQSWGCKHKYKKDGKETTIRVGLECSGFVTWALRNGRFNLGDWRSAFYKTHEYFKFYDREYNDLKKRNYQIPKFMHGTCLLNENGNCIVPGSNENNDFDNVMLKFSNIVPETDILEISKITKAQSKTIKAGDIVQHPKYYCERENNGEGDCITNKDNKRIKCDPTKNKKKCGKPVSGHIAMIIAVNRDKDGYPKEIFIGEATSAGNKVTKFESWDAFSKGKDIKGNTSAWSKTYLYPSYIVKMDHVYDYSWNETVSKDKDNNLLDKNGGKKDKDGNLYNGNTYKYTDMWK